MSEQSNTPVLFLVFNRLDTAKQVFEAIRNAAPQRLYVASDGPRETKEGEREKVEKIREYVLNHIDWNCEVKTLFREKNLGCGPAVKQAIDWFFEHEEMGIIFEDDTVPDQSFFPYVEELLNRYANDDRIGMISGNNHAGFPQIDDSYVFSKFQWTWGWATWRRAWAKMDFELTCLQSAYKENIIRNMGYNKISYNYWTKNIEAIDTKLVNAWDYQWFFSLGAQNQMGIFPRVNLVSNIGFGNGATHTFGDAPEKFICIEKLKFPLLHPKYILPNYEFEKMFQDSMIPRPSILGRIIPARIKKIIKSLIKR